MKPTASLLLIFSLLVVPAYAERCPEPILLQSNDSASGGGHKNRTGEAFVVTAIIAGIVCAVTSCLSDKEPVAFTGAQKAPN